MSIFWGFRVISTQLDGEGDTPGNMQDEAEQSKDSKKRKASEPSIQASTVKAKKQKKKAQAGPTEYGVTRGIDFIDVACVINFDLPASSRSYVHRVGRTARAGRSGMSLSFVVPQNLWGPKHQKGGFETSLKGAKRDDRVWKRIERDQKAAGVGPDGLKEYRFDMKQVEGFRYRMEDGLRSVTRAYVREARIKEIKNEVLNSDKLKVRTFSPSSSSSPLSLHMPLENVIG